MTFCVKFVADAVAGAGTLSGVDTMRSVTIRSNETEEKLLEQRREGIFVKCIF